MTCNLSDDENKPPQAIAAKFHIFQSIQSHHLENRRTEMEFHNYPRSCDNLFPGPLPEVIKTEIENQLLKRLPVSSVNATSQPLNTTSKVKCFTEFTVPAWGLFWDSYIPTIIDSRYNYANSIRNYYEFDSSEAKPNFSEVGVLPIFVPRGNHKVFELRCIKHDYQGPLNITLDYGGLNVSDVKIRDYYYDGRRRDFTSVFNVTEDMAGSYEISCHYSQDNNVTDFNKTIKLIVQVYKVVSSSDNCSEEKEVKYFCQHLI